ncbi:MAG: hypothetical protein ABMB14_39945, partial [Myxococcota bacterium]
QAQDRCVRIDGAFAATADDQVFPPGPAIASWGPADAGLDPSEWTLLSDCKRKSRPVATGIYATAGETLLIASSNGSISPVAIVDEASGAPLFSATTLYGDHSVQTHSVELLPDGNLVGVGPGWGSGACPSDLSSSSTDLALGEGMLRLWDVETGASRDLTLCEAHAAAWDVTRQVLFVATYTYVVELRYDGFDAAAPFTELARFTYPDGPASQVTNRGGHDLQLGPLPDAFVVSSDLTATFVLDPTTGQFLGHAPANCRFSTTYWQCNVFGIPNYGLDTGTPQVKGVSIDPATDAALIVRADGTGSTGDSWTSDAVMVFGPDHYYTVQDPAWALYKVRAGAVQPTH